MRKLRFYLNKELDKIMAEQFLDETGGGIDFSKNVLRTHPDLKDAKLNIQHRKKIVSDYFDAYYRVHGVEMEQKVERVKSTWAKQGHEYVAVTENYFSGFPFPAGKYIAYASIIDCNPRFLEQKTFQFFYKKPVADIIHTIAHELLHFIFFDFVERKMKKEIQLLSQDQLWDLSEIFNVVILRNVKVIATEIFSALIAVFVLVDALLSKTVTEFVLKFALFGGVRCSNYPKCFK